MTAPFTFVRIKVFPGTEEVLVGNTLYHSPDELWAALMSNGEKALEKVSIPQTFIQSPEVAEALAQGRITKLPQVSEPQHIKDARKVKPKPKPKLDLDSLEIDLSHIGTEGPEF